jgi:hypothetical protein
MSRTRPTLNCFSYKLRSEKYLYQASDSEIRSDLEKLNYVNPQKKPSEPVANETVLQKKRETQAPGPEYVIDGLVKLMSYKPNEVRRKKSEQIIEKKIEPPAVQPTKTAQCVPVFSYFSLQNNYGIPDMGMMGQNYYYPNLQFTPAAVRSSADYHLKLAKYIETHKVNGISSA